jgi:biopolymer transport protein ExbD
MSEENNIKPDITPAININFVILVMTLLIASHGAKLLPFQLPGAEKETKYVKMEETILLKVNKNNSYNLGGAVGLDKKGLQAELAKLGNGTIVRIDIEAGSKYSALVDAVDSIEALDQVEVAFGQMLGGITPAATSSKPDTAPVE